MKELSPLDTQLAIADQHTATAAILMLAVVGYLLAGRLFRNRFPHLTVWLLFGVWSALVAFVPALRELDANQPWFYGLRGLPLGMVVVSMTRFHELAPRRGAGTTTE